MLSPRAIAGQPSRCGAVGVPRAERNQSRVTGWKRARGSESGGCGGMAGEVLDDFDETRDRADVLLEFLGELLLFLVAPGPFQGHHLGPQRGNAVLHVAVELLETLREPPQFFRIDNGLRHETSLPAISGRR